MTKPIEGWVEIYGNEPYIFCDGHTKDGEPFARRLHVHLDDPEFLSSARFRPVRITFTDEARNYQWDEKIETEINNFKERVWAIISSSQNYADKTVNLQTVEEAIFGEEK